MLARHVEWMTISVPVSVLSIRSNAKPEATSVAE